MNTTNMSLDDINIALRMRAARGGLIAELDATVRALARSKSKVDRGDAVDLAKVLEHARHGRYKAAYEVYSGLDTGARENVSTALADVLQTHSSVMVGAMEVDELYARMRLPYLQLARKRVMVDAARLDKEEALLNKLAKKPAKKSAKKSAPHGTNGPVGATPFTRLHKKRVARLERVLQIRHSGCGTQFGLWLDTATWQWKARIALEDRVDGSVQRHYEGCSLYTPDHALEVLERVVSRLEKDKA